MPGRGLEPLRIAPPDPKSGASANFATLASSLLRRKYSSHHRQSKHSRSSGMSVARTNSPPPAASRLWSTTALFTSTKPPFSANELARSKMSVRRWVAGATTLAKSALIRSPRRSSHRVPRQALERRHFLRTRKLEGSSERTANLYLLISRSSPLAAAEKRKRCGFV
jgi:hypothetical protein